MSNADELQKSHLILILGFYVQGLFIRIPFPTRAAKSKFQFHTEPKDYSIKESLW